MRTSGSFMELPHLPRFGDLWDSTVRRLTCWGEGCRVVLTDNVQWVQGAAQERALDTWKSLQGGEGRFVFSLFRRQLAVFIPSFDPAVQIQADLLKERSFWLRDLNFNAAAFSVLIPLAPPGLNFTSFWVSDVRVSWRNLLSLTQNPIILEIDSVRAHAAEQPAGTDEEIEDLITSWLDVLGGSNPVPFQGSYPLLDGATFRISRVHLDVDSPTQYGNLSVDLEGVEILAVDEEGRPRELSSLCKAGLQDQTITFHRLVDCSKASVRYVGREEDVDAGSSGEPEAEAAEELDWAGIPFLAAAARAAAASAQALSEQPPPPEHEGEQFLLYPTAVAAMMTQKSSVDDMRRVLQQRWTLAFPGPARILTLPPLLSPGPDPPPQDPRLFPYTAPTTEWHVRFAEGSPFHWHFSPFQPHRPQMHPIAATVFTVIFVGAILAIFAECSPRPWLRRLLGKAAAVMHLLH